MATVNSESDPTLNPNEEVREDAEPVEEEQPSGQEFDEEGTPEDPNAGF